MCPVSSCPRVCLVRGRYLSGQDALCNGIAGAAMGGFMCAVAMSKRVLWSELNVLLAPPWAATWTDGSHKTHTQPTHAASASAEDTLP